MLIGWLGCDGLGNSPFNLSVNTSLAVTTGQEFVAHIVQHRHVWHTEKDTTEEVVAYESVASKSQRRSAVLATEAASMEEPTFGAHAFHQIDSFAAKMARLRASLLRKIEHWFWPERFRLIIHTGHFRHLFRQLLSHGGNLIAASMARVQHTAFC